MPLTAGRSAFQAVPERQPFVPVHYLYGEDAYLKEDAVNALVTAAVEPATRDFNLQQCKAGDLTGETLSILLNTPPMMAERRVVVIRDVDALRKDARGALDQYLEKPSPETVLILVTTGDAKVDKRLAAAGNAMDYKALTGAKLEKWIVQRAEALGARITNPAITALQNIVGSELLQLSIELEKLVNYAGSGAITEESVAALVGRREETLSALLDAVAGKNAVAALTVLAPALRQPKASAVTIVMALTVQTLALAWGHASGLHGSRLTSEYYDLLKKSGSLFTGRAWSEAIPAWTKSISLWSSRELDDALNALGHADLMLKDTGLSSEEQVLATLILTLCGPHASPRMA